VNLATRARMRPVLYPVGILAGFVLFLLVNWGVSPYSAGRPLLIALAVGLALPWLFGLLVGDRHRAGLLAALVVLLLLAGQSPIAAALIAGVFLILLAESWTGRGRSRRIRWPVITRAMSAVSAILLVAIGILAVQNGGIVRIPRDLVAEAPVGRFGSPAMATTQPLPSVYLILLDGYPRADKLMTEFGIDNGSFVQALRERDFTVAERSRSNYVVTALTLASMFSGGVPSGGDVDSAEFRIAATSYINEGAILQRFRDRGYDIVAFSSGFEGVALRRADRFVDTGQLNEFEWELLQLSGLLPVLDIVHPTLLADQHRARIVAMLDVARDVAAHPAPRPRLAFIHVPSPHSPQVFGPSGEAIEIRGLQVPFDDSEEQWLLGLEEYARRLAGQITFLNSQVLELVDAVGREEPGAVVVVFSDHGSGVREVATTAAATDPDLRTANLLAVRSPGQPGLIDDRSTLINVLPRILRAYTGSGPQDVPETIYGQPVDGRPAVFERPD
jgi:hypothetical protein